MQYKNYSLVCKYNLKYTSYFPDFTLYKECKLSIRYIFSAVFFTMVLFIYEIMISIFRMYMTHLN